MLVYGLFGLYGVLLAMIGWMTMYVMDDIEMACYIGEFALQVQEKSKTGLGKAKVLTFLSTFTYLPYETPAELFKTTFGVLSEWYEN
eukprot:4949159-Ditylum_brightwellii.AAC.1